MFGTSEQIMLAKMVKIHCWFLIPQLLQFRGQNKGKRRDEGERRVIILNCDIPCSTE